MNNSFVMKKIVLAAFILCTIFFPTSLLSQDKIILTNGKEVLAEISEITSNTIKYKKANHPEGPLYITKKGKVSRIIYKNGEIEEFKLIKEYDSFKRNIFNYHISDVLYNNISFSYEHIFKSGKTGLKLPVAIGYNFNSYGVYHFSNVAYSGLGLNIFPAGQKEVCYYFGPEINIGQGRIQDWKYTEGEDGFPEWYKETEEFIYGRLYINNGIHYYPTKNFSLSASLGFGISYLEREDRRASGFRSSGYFTVSIGYKF